MGTLKDTERSSAGAGCAPCIAEIAKALDQRLSAADAADEVERQRVELELDRLARVIRKGAENISPDDHRKLRGLLNYYRKKAHPFGACVRDNTKRFGPEGAKRVCATLKDEIEGNPYWRNKPGPGR